MVVTGDRRVDTESGRRVMEWVLHAQANLTQQTAACLDDT